MLFKKKTPIAPTGRYRPTPRSATLGQPNARVFSYHAKRSALPSHVGRGEQPPITAASAKRHKTQRLWFKRAPFIAGFMVLLVVVTLNLPVSNKPTVLAAKDARGGIFLRSAATYTQAAHQLLAGSFRNSNKLTIDSNRIAHDLRAQFPELASVMVSVPFFGSGLVIHLQPTTPTLVLTTNATEVYVLDENGHALIAAGQVPGLSKLALPVVKDESPLPVRLGEGVLPSSSVSFITEVVGQLKAKNIAIEGMTLPLGTSELDVKVKGVPYNVKFNLMGDARAEAGTYLAVKQRLEAGHVTPGSYIDVRVDERAYYK